jgi:hypothetical protein
LISRGAVTAGQSGWDDGITHMVHT